MTEQDQLKAFVTDLIRDNAASWNGDLDTAPDMDSLSYIECAFEIEDAYGIEMPMDLSTLATPRDLMNIISEKMGWDKTEASTKTPVLD